MSGGYDQRGPSSRAGSNSAAGSNEVVPGKRTLTEGLQLRTTRDLGAAASDLGRVDSGGTVQQAAAQGIAGGGGSLPHGDTIQRLFGHHDVSGIAAHVGGEAGAACRAIGAEAYATGHHVAFAGTPSLHTAAHEAAHVVHQRGGVQLKGGVGEAGDQHEQHADQVADAVAAGRSAEGLLDSYSGGGGVQRQEVQRKPDTATPAADPAAHLIQLLSSPGPGAGGDPVATYLNTLDTPALLAALDGAVDGGYAPQLHTRLAAARPMLVAALYAAELARTGVVAANHPLLQRAGVVLDQVSRDQQLQIFSYLLHRRGVSVEAATLVEGVLAMREAGDHDNAATSKEPQPAGAGRGAADAADAADAPVGDEQATGAAVGAAVTGGAAPPAPINPGPWAPPGNQPGGWYVGTSAHTAIAAAYRAAHSGQLVFTNNTPLSSILDELEQMPGNDTRPNRGALDESELLRRPDIANMPRRHLYEIKPTAVQAEAAARANMYLSLFAKAGVAMTLGPIGEPGTSGGLQAPAGVFLFQSPEPGVITYEYRRGRLVPVPVPQPDPAKERRWRWELQPLTPQQRQAIVTTTLGGAMLIILMIILAPVGA